VVEEVVVPLQERLARVRAHIADAREMAKEDVILAAQVIADSGVIAPPEIALAWFSHAHGHIKPPMQVILSKLERHEITTEEGWDMVTPMIRASELLYASLEVMTFAALLCSEAELVDTIAQEILGTAGIQPMGDN
jgi:hypothetical protein